mmetsp:Transcript_3925/g.8874  ORF Transcript_3925/g.8874 Transcript_3925/m.8874 type:complete len:236 (+) Transcript_3925:800-1507(+)
MPNGKVRPATTPATLSATIDACNKGASILNHRRVSIISIGVLGFAKRWVFSQTKKTFHLRSIGFRSRSRILLCPSVSLGIIHKSFGHGIVSPVTSRDNIACERSMLSFRLCTPSRKSFSTPMAREMSCKSSCMVPNILPCSSTSFCCCETNLSRDSRTKPVPSASRASFSSVFFSMPPATNTLSPCDAIPAYLRVVDMSGRVVQVSFSVLYASLLPSSAPSRTTIVSPKGMARDP